MPISQAEDVVSALQAKKFYVEFVREEGKDHLYDRDPSEDMKEMYAFIKKFSS